LGQGVEHLINEARKKGVYESLFPLRIILAHSVIFIDEGQIDSNMILDKIQNEEKHVVTLEEICYFG
jgi:hypothetical protein